MACFGIVFLCSLGRLNVNVTLSTGQAVKDITIYSSVSFGSYVCPRNQTILTPNCVSISAPLKIETRVSRPKPILVGIEIVPLCPLKTQTTYS